MSITVSFYCHRPSCWQWVFSKHSQEAIKHHMGEIRACCRAWRHRSTVASFSARIHYRFWFMRSEKIVNENQGGKPIKIAQTLPRLARNWNPCEYRMAIIEPAKDECVEETTIAIVVCIGCQLEGRIDSRWESQDFLRLSSRWRERKSKKKARNTEPHFFFAGHVCLAILLCDIQ